MQKISQSQNRIFSWIFPHFSSFCCSLTLFIICFFFFPLFICELRVYWFLFAFLKHFLLNQSCFFSKKSTDMNGNWISKIRSLIFEFFSNASIYYMRICMFVYLFYIFYINFKSILFWSHFLSFNSHCFHKCLLFFCIVVIVCYCFFYWYSWKDGK